MAQKAYGGISNIARNGIKLYGGVNNIARNVIKGYVGDENGIARQFWGVWQKPKHLIQVFDETYVNGQTYIMNKGSVSAAIRYAIEEWIYLDRYTNEFDTSLKAKVKNTINSIVAYANNLNPNADYVVTSVLSYSSNPLTYRVNVYMANADTSAVRVTSNETNTGWRRYIGNVANVTYTNISGFSCFIKMDEVTFSTNTSSNSNLLGTILNYTSNKSLVSKNLGVHYVEREEDDYIAIWDFITAVGNKYDEVDQTVMDVGSGYTMPWDDEGIHIYDARRGKLSLPCYYSLPGMTYEIDFGAMSGPLTVAGDSRIFTYPIASNRQGGILWNRSEGCYATYDTTNGWQYSSITDFDYFKNSTMKIEIDSNNNWIIYRNNVRVFSASNMNNKYQYQSCFELGNTNSYNNYDVAIKAIRIYETGKIIKPTISKIFDYPAVNPTSFTIPKDGLYLIMTSGGAGINQNSIVVSDRSSILGDDLSVSAGGYDRWMKYRIYKLRSGDVVQFPDTYNTSQWLSYQRTIYELEGVDITNNSSVVSTMSQADGMAYLSRLSDNDLYFIIGVALGRWQTGSFRDDTPIGQTNPIVYDKGDSVGVGTVNGLYYAEGLSMPTVSMYGYDGGAAFVIGIKL